VVVSALRGAAGINQAIPVQSFGQGLERPDNPFNAATSARELLQHRWNSRPSSRSALPKAPPYMAPAAQVGDEPGREVRDG